MEILKLLQEGDVAGLDMEKSRVALDAAKAALEQAKEQFELMKSQFEQVVSRADEAGMPRAKFKKLLEDRTAALWASGLIQPSDERPKAPKAPRAVRKTKTVESDEGSYDPIENQDQAEMVTVN